MSRRALEKLFIFTSLVEILILLSIMRRHFPAKAVKIKKQKHPIV